MYKIIIGVVIVTVIAIVGFMIIDPNINVTRIDESAEVLDSLNSFSVTIEGEILNQGTYTMNEGSSMGELIQAAGGLKSSADLRCFYEEYVISKGMTYYIPSLYDYSELCNDKEISKVNINNDDAETLMSVNGISASIASSIVSYRTSSGRFETLEDLLNVYGIGNVTFKKIRNYVYLHE